VENIIIIENLKVEFGDHVALDNLQLNIAEGAFVAIVGPNGAGKSTFLKVLLGLIRPSSGKVRLYGKYLKKSRRNISVMCPR